MGKILVKKTANGGFGFTIVANNGEVVGVSQTYKSMDSLNNGIESVKKNAQSEIEDQTLQKVEEKKCPKWELYYDKGGEIRFRLKASNGEIILAASEGYSARASAKNGIDSIRRNIDSPIVQEE